MSDGSPDTTQRDTVPPTTRDLLAALARGDLTAVETIQELKQRQIECLEVLVTLLDATASLSPERQTALQEFIDPQKFANTPSDTFPAVHKAPRLPVLLNGTLYDPCDIKRFDGTALHFVPAYEHILAFDDRRLMERYWMTSIVAAAAQHGGYPDNTVDYGNYLGPTKPPPPPTPGGVKPATTGGPVIVVGQPGPSQGGGSEWNAKYDYSTTYFYEDYNYTGEWKALHANRGYVNLSNVGRGGLGLGNFDNVISSVSTMNYIVALYDGYHYGGSSLTLQRGSSDRNGWHYLEHYGWNDRASSIGTW